MSRIIDCEHWRRVFLFVYWQSIHTFSSRQCQRRQWQRRLNTGILYSETFVKFNVVWVHVVSEQNNIMPVDCHRWQKSMEHKPFWLLTTFSRRKRRHSFRSYTLCLSLHCETRMQMSQRLITHSDFEYERNINSVWEYGGMEKKFHLTKISEKRPNTQIELHTHTTTIHPHSLCVLNAKIWIISGWRLKYLWHCAPNYTGHYIATVLPR